MQITEDEYRRRVPDLDPTHYFATQEDFERFMLQIDSDMRKEGVPIVERQIKSHSEAAKRLRTNLYWVPASFAHDGDYSNLSLSAHISNWFTQQYGARLGTDMAGVRTIGRIGGDLYKVNIPLVLGKPRLVFLATEKP